MQCSSSLVFRQLLDRDSCTFTYLLADAVARRAILIDPVDRHIDRDTRLLRELNLELCYVVNTHAHADHISASGLLKQRLPGVKSAIGRASTAKADILFDEGDSLRVSDKLSLSVLSTPGHTEGCASYLLRESEDYPSCVFTGDALMIRGCGRTDFQGGNAERLYASVKEKLFTLPADTLVYPAHDYKGNTTSTIGEEAEFNPRLGKGKSLQDFVDIMQNLNLAHPKMMDKAVPVNLNCGIPPEY